MEYNPNLQKGTRDPITTRSVQVPRLESMLANLSHDPTSGKSPAERDDHEAIEALGKRAAELGVDIIDFMNEPEHAGDPVRKQFQKASAGMWMYRLLPEDKTALLEKLARMDVVVEPTASIEEIKTAIQHRIDSLNQEDAV